MRRKANDSLISHVMQRKIAAVRRALERGGDPNERDQGGRTPLHWAAQEGLVDIARCLIRFGAEVDATDALGFTALAIAAGEGKRSVVRCLLAAGAAPDVRIRGNANGTALHLACSWRRTGVAKILVEIGGADLNAKDEHGKTPLAYALDSGGKELAAFLTRRGGVA